MKPYVVLEKRVGETPLSCVEKWREEQTSGGYQNVPLAYAGRLDPMASGKLLILLGKECKEQGKYHGLDKEYVFEVLFGVASDTADVLGLLSTCEVPKIDTNMLKAASKKLTGEIELPYPHFSSKTVQGKPLHTWKLEGRIGEIKIPTKKSVIHLLQLQHLREVTIQEIYVNASHNIESIPKVTDIRKAIGNDFRRVDVRLSWKTFMESHSPTQRLYVAKFICIASSGTYMRTLSEVIARELGTCGLAYSIHRTKIGVYKKLFNRFGFWTKQF